MLLSNSWLEMIAGADETKAGHQLAENQGVYLSEESPEMLRFLVADTPAREVLLRSELNARCTCETFENRHACRHVIAALIQARKQEKLSLLIRSHAGTAGLSMLDEIDNVLPTDGNIRLEVTVCPKPGSDKPLMVGFRTGEEKLYVIKNIPRFLDSMERGEPLSFGKGFEYRPEWMRFGPAETKVLSPVRAYCSATGSTGFSQEDARFLPLPEAFACMLLDALTVCPFRLAKADGKMVRLSGIPEARLPLFFSLSGTLHGLRLNAVLPKGLFPVVSSCRYVYVQDRIISVPESQQRLLRFLWQHQVDGACLFEFPLSETDRVIGELVPNLKRSGVVDLSDELEKKLIRLPLKTVIYLDTEEKDLLARTEFHYGETVLNPFHIEKEKKVLQRGAGLLLRDGESERAVLDILGASGFRVHGEKIYLSGQEAIWNFITEGVHVLQKQAEIYLSKDFERLRPRKPTLSGSVTLQESHLLAKLEIDGEPTDEILQIMEALNRHRRYFRLKDGSFLDLQGLDEWQPVAETLTDGSAVFSAQHNAVELSAARAVYMKNLLDQHKLPVEQDETFKNLMTPEDPEAPQLAGCMELRPYQLAGYRWLRNLDRMHLGGILADAMGTGKTVQVISLLLSCREAGRTSLVVSPTSLVWNWEAELKRFAPELSVTVLSGSIAQREEVIRHVREHGDVDVLITSYPLMRRDAGALKEICFRFAILDEAQHIKNAASIGAGSARLLRADTRFALTGTPMENGVGELWSLFDFVLPGYLPGYQAFLRKYQDGMNHEELLQRIRPFMLRRLKEQVLSELPEKQETILTARMSPEQEKVYQAAMVRMRPRIQLLMSEKGLNQSRIEVLAALTELRQICCHPGLVLQGYHGTSGKMEMLMDLMPGYVTAGHRVLLFSQFTSMLKILKDQLEQEGYRTMYLDGDTPARERIELVEQFNGGGAEIFLISLKAGGSGLNLTGADIVIQYDPWWNPAAEAQAADRAHRIGQKRKVEVLRLVTAGSIEEQVVALGERKRALFDLLITPGETPVSALTEQDIRSMFS